MGKKGSKENQRKELWNGEARRKKDEIKYAKKRKKKGTENRI